MHSMRGLKNILEHSYWAKIFLQHTIPLVVALSLIVLYNAPQYFKLFVAIEAILFLGYFLITKHILPSLLLLLFVTSFFITPGKMYQVVVVEPGKIRPEPFFSAGMVEEYGLLASDIAALTIIAYFIREVVVSTVYKQKSTFVELLKNVKIRFVLFCWVIYFFISLYASSATSFNATFSIAHLLQGMKIVPMFCATLYVLAVSKKRPKLISDMLMGTILTLIAFGLYQFVAGLVQFQNQRDIPFYAISEEYYSLPRPSGLLLYANQYGFFLLLFLFCFLMLQRGRLRAILPIVTTLAATTGIILSQSRSVWLIAVINLLLYLRLEWRRISIHLREILYNWKGIKFVPFAVLLSLLLIIPRIESLRYAFDQGSGSLRLEMITEGAAALREHLYTGYGVNTIVRVLSEYFPKGYVRDFPYAVHLGYLQMALESGVVAMIFFFLPFFVQLRRNALALMQTGFRRHHALSLMLVLSILIYYCLQPYAGAQELPFLGLFLAICTYYTL